MTRLVGSPDPTQPMIRSSSSSGCPSSIGSSKIRDWRGADVVSSLTSGTARPWYRRARAGLANAAIVPYR